jgi:hypothetical protein
MDLHTKHKTLLMTFERMLGEEKLVLQEPREFSALTTILAAIKSTDNPYYLSYSQDNPKQISFAVDNETKFDDRKRVRSTFGRFVRKRLNISQEDLSDKSLSMVTSYLFGHLSTPDEGIRVVNGKDITKAYANEWGEHTCMTGIDRLDIIQLFETNPDKISLILYDNIIKARALLWHTDEGIKVMDRIYPDDTAHIEVLKLWATKKGYVYRIPNGLCECEVSLSDDNNHRVTVRACSLYPYMDTFKYGQEDNRGERIILSNCPTGAVYILDDTNGHLSPLVICVYCNEYIYNDEDMFADPGGDSICSYCFENRYFMCNACDCPFSQEEQTEVLVMSRDSYPYQEYWCKRCVEMYTRVCAKCNKVFTIAGSTCPPECELCLSCKPLESSTQESKFPKFVATGNSVT